jgi:AcrR family transcriptional regulator
MRTTPSNIATLRREQIVEAAVAIIAEQGLHNLSLSEIEKKAGMSRGQLTYYFPTKEAILLAVFDHLLLMMYRRHGNDAGEAPVQGGCGGPPCEQPAAEGACKGPGGLSGWEGVQWLFRTIIMRPPENPEFHALQYTFLSQIGYREDFRQRLATLYEQWRSNLARGLQEDCQTGKLTRPVSPRAMSTLVQAILHGLTMQAAADPAAFDGEEMARLCLDVLGSYLGARQNDPSPEEAIAEPKNSTSERAGPQPPRAVPAPRG